MAPTTEVTTETGLPQGTWRIDPVHSSAAFAVKHMGVSTFQGRFEGIDATLSVGEDGTPWLVGVARTDSIVVKDENLRAHLLSPEFFDVERYPEIRFASDAIRVEGDEVAVEGDLTIKDRTQRVEAGGRIHGPITGLGDSIRLGISLEAIVDRTEFGIDWNAELPQGGVALGDDVKLTVELELVLVA